MLPNKGILLISNISLGNYESFDAGIKTPEPIYRLNNLNIYDYKELIKFNFNDVFNIKLEFTEGKK